MRANIFRAAALAGIVAVFAAPAATAEPSSLVVAYTAHYGGVVCDVLDQYPSISGVLGVMQGVQNDGFTAYESGEIVGLSVAEICPRHTGLMLRFIDVYGGNEGYI